MEEERLLRKIEADRAKLQREYYNEIRQRELLVSLYFGFLLILMNTCYIKELFW